METDANVSSGDISVVVTLEHDIIQADTNSEKVDNQTEERGEKNIQTVTMVPDDNSSVGRASENTQETAESNAIEEDKKLSPPIMQQSSIRLALRKSVRNRNKPKTVSQPVRQLATKGKSRRNIFKRCVNRSSLEFVTPVTSDNIFFRGSYMQKGDIVSLIDIEGGTYFAQITGFLQDKFCEKSATITWLIPTKFSPQNGVFDPATYVLGPEEEYPRKLEAMQFVMHAPSDYYKSNAPYPSVVPSTAGFIWTQLGPQVVHSHELRNI